MRILFLDAATRTGWAIVEGTCAAQRLMSSGAVDASTAKAVARFVASLSTWPVPDLCVIEEPYLDETKRNVRSLKVLAYGVGRWLQELERVDFGTALVTADTWQLGLLTGLITPASKREERKRAAQRMVSILYGGYRCGEDEADAICGATWAVRQGSVLALAGAASPTIAGLGSGRRWHRPRRAG